MSQLVRRQLGRRSPLEGTSISRWPIFLTVGSAIFMSSIDQTIVATAVPAIQQSLNAPLSWAAWTLTIYALGQIIAKPMAGSVIARFGDRSVFLLASVVFTTGSLICGLSDSIYMLIALRGIQALGGGCLMPSATEIVARTFGQHRDRAIGSFSSIVPIGALLGPAVGGMLVTYWSWRIIFLVNVPLGLVITLVALRVLPSSMRAKGSNLDIVGVCQLAFGLLGLMYGLTYVSTHSGAGSVRAAATWLVLGATGLTLYLRHSRVVQHPLVPPLFLWGRGFGAMNLLNLVYGAAALGFSALVPLYAIRRYGISALGAGSLLTARAVGVILMSGVAITLMRRTGYRFLMIVGFAFTAAGLVMMFYLPSGWSPYHWLAIAAAVTGVGMGLAGPVSSNAGLYLAPDRMGTLAGLRGMFRQSGSILAVTITALAMSHAKNQGLCEAQAFVAFAVVLMGVTPLVLRIPDRKGAW